MIRSRKQETPCQVHDRHFLNVTDRPYPLIMEKLCLFRIWRKWYTYSQRFSRSGSGTLNKISGRVMMNGGIANAGLSALSCGQTRLSIYFAVALGNLNKRNGFITLQVWPSFPILTAPKCRFNHWIISLILWSMFLRGLHNNPLNHTSLLLITSVPCCIHNSRSILSIDTSIPVTWFSGTPKRSVLYSRPVLHPTPHDLRVLSTWRQCLQLPSQQYFPTHRLRRIWNPLPNE